MSSSQNGERRHDASGPPLSRPEWMLAPPPSASIGDMLRSDPRAALKSRGFAQSASQRVQKSGSGGGGALDQATLWTETPAERAERLRDEELGVRRKATLVEAGPSGGVQKDQAEREREDRIRAAVEQHKHTRGPSLLEQHQAKRRSELRKREGGSDDEEEEERRRRRRKEKERKESRRRDEERDDDPRREKRHKHRRRSVSLSDSDRSDDRADKRERRHRERREDHRRRDDEKARSSRRSRSRSPARHEDKREERERRREKERKKRRREEEEREEKKGAPMMVWDREAALSVGGRLMDERKRVDMIKNASSLNDRFGSGSSRYM